MTTIPPDEPLRLTQDGPVATLWLNRPAKRNAVTYAMWQDITSFCRRLADDPTVRLVVVRGVGGHFCAGADIGGLADIHPDEYREANRVADEALATLPQPTVAFISGACVGGGAEIAIACDLRVADTTARFGITPARLGILYPPAALERVVALIGPGAAKHLLYTAEIVTSDHALRIGLVHEVHDPDRALRRLAELGDLLTGPRSQLTQRATKAMVADVGAHGHVQPETAATWSAEVMASADPAEGIAAFLERRQPNFTWPA